MLERLGKKITTNTETKPFYTTSEFYVLIGAGIQTVLNGPHDTKSLIIDGIAAVYAVSRGFAKSGSKPAPPAPPTSV